MRHRGSSTTFKQYSKISNLITFMIPGLDFRLKYSPDLSKYMADLYASIQ